MSIKSPMLQLAAPQLAKLTNESEEIRMRALDQVETRFIRCLQLGESIDFKPLLLMKQLIRWFGQTPHLAADRVLAIMLELLRSEYGSVVVRKITYERLSIELGKVRRILRPQESKRVTDLLDEMQYLLLQKYNIRLETPLGSSASSVNVTTEGTESVTSSISALKATLKPDDYERAWSQPCLQDVASLQSLLDMPRNGETDAIEVQVQLTHLTIRLADYPAEYLLQPPYTFLILVQLQQRRDGCLLHVNRAMTEYLKRLQSRIEVRCNTLCYSSSLDAPGSGPQQVRVESALALLVNSCLDIAFKCSVNDKWHVLELIQEAVKTYEVLKVAVPPCLATRFVGIVKKLLKLCEGQIGRNLTQLGSQTSPNFTDLVSSLMVPRLQSLILNDQLMEVALLNISCEKDLSRSQVHHLLRPILMDSCYLNLPGRMTALSEMRGLSLQSSTDDENLYKMKLAYAMALDQFQPTTRAKAPLLIQSKEVRLVLNQLGSQKLLKLLFDAVVECIPLYRGNPQLRTEAEELLCTLLDLPDKKLRWFVYGLMGKPVTSHFHAIMSKGVYLAGCNSQELVRQNILGLPLTTEFLRRVALQSWDKETPDNVRQWCLDYFLLLFKLNCFLDKKDILSIFQIIIPLLPLLICRSITDTQLDNVIWQMWNPKTCILDPPLMMRVYVCYLFHPNSDLREKAPIPISCLRQNMDKIKKTRNSRNELTYKWGDPDLCMIQPPVNYKDIFAEPTNEAFQGKRTLDALVRLLDAKEFLRPSIRKSSMTQLNVLLRNWKACECFTSEEGLSMIVYSLANGLHHNGGEPGDILVPAVSILMKLMLQNPGFRVKVAYTPDMYMNLLRIMLLLPHERGLRQDASICLFLMLFYDSIDAREDKMVIDIPLGGLLAPVNLEQRLTEPSSAVIEGIELQRRLDAGYFGEDGESSAQHWRLFLSHHISKTMNFESLQDVDIRNELKMNMGDMAMMQASEAEDQLRSQLSAASNCSSHEALQQRIDIIQLFLVHLGRSVSETESESMWQVIHKYLRSVPANDADCKLYISLLELCLSCLRFSLLPVIKGLSEALETDPNHSIFLLLQDRNTSLDVMYLIGECLELLLVEDFETRLDWHSKLFHQLSAVARKHFEIRQLQHVRCILGILRRLSEQDLTLNGDQVMQYCQDFMQLSSDLRTSTQTGAQWQRDCLHIICEIHLRQVSGRPNAMCEPGATNDVLRYLLGLCGHCDDAVRALSWVLMGDWLICCNVQKENILPGLSFLPGGLPACCLTTLLDVHEVMVVRLLAGSVFVQLMPLVGAEGCVDLLRNHTFLKDASRALRTLHVAAHVDKPPVGEQHSCEIIGCYVAVCVTMVGLDPGWCRATLCQHSFMTGLSDVIKTPPPPPYPSSFAFYEMCAEYICELYALCYVNNFEFLQRSICRDTVFLQSFVALINNVMDLDPNERLLSQLFKLLLVLCKDSNSFAYLCAELKDRPSFVIDFFMVGLHRSSNGTDIMRYTLKCLALVFMNKQSTPLLRQMETYIVPWPQGCDPVKPAEDSARNPKDSAPNPLGLAGTEINAIQFIYQIIEQEFLSYYTARGFNFLQPLSPDHIQVCETFGIFLKYSYMGAAVADEGQLVGGIITILDIFLNDDKIGTASCYVRRVGAHKSQEILGNLLVLFKMLSQWFSSHLSVIKEPSTAVKMTKTLVRLWPWLSHSAELKQLVVQVVMFFTEHSFEMCKQTSLVLAGQSHSLLQLMSRVADFETTRKENNAGPVGEGTCLIPALRVMSNCCSCSEGRLALSKMHVLDMFDTLLPAHPSGHKVRIPVVQAWLAFWEVYSRYDVGAKACHLQSLLKIIKRMEPLEDRRILCFRILRNMCFYNVNRTVLTEMLEFVNMLRDIVNQPILLKDPASGQAVISLEEHRQAVLMLYKLYGFGAKYKAKLRGTKLVRGLNQLKDQLVGMKIENPDRFSSISYAVQLLGLLTKLLEALEV